jgi:outer membrane protein assembly factor BamB/SAM-dependent methyltransferase
MAEDKPSVSNNPTKTAGDPFANNELAKISGFPTQATVFANRGGLCLDLGCGNGALAAEIVQKTKYAVFALAKDDADCDQTRQTLDNVGIYGTRATSMTGSLQKLPFPNGYGNLIVTGEYMASLDLKEVFRVLNPNGIAVIGGGKTDSGKLKDAIAAAGVKDFKIEGNYAIFYGKMPEGVDDWTHLTPRPDNIATSRETVVRPPFRTQWFQTDPARRAGDAHETIGQGRMVYRCGGTIYASDAFNGALLWERKLKSPRVSVQALVNGAYYLIENDTILALDAATGNVNREYRIPDPKWSEPWTYTVERSDNLSRTQEKVSGVYWRWLAVENGALYGLAQTPTTETCLIGTGDLFCCFDVESGAVRWKHQLNSPADFGSVALSGEAMYFFVFQKNYLAEKKLDTKGEATIFALNTKTGEEIWQGKLGLMNASSGWPAPAPLAGFIDGKYFVWSCLADNGKIGGTKAFDGKTGTLVKEYPDLTVQACGQGPVLFVDDKMYSNQHSKAPGAKQAYYEYRAVDRATGKDVFLNFDNQNLKTGCGAGCASQNCLYAGGQNMSARDLLTGKIWRAQYFRSPCNSGPRPANGMLFMFGGFCHCTYAMGAPVSLAPAGPDWMPPKANKDLAARLFPGPAFKQPLLETGGDDWTHYRGNAGHTGETSSEPALLAPGWERKLSGRLTPPSCGGGLVYVASLDGTVWGLDQKTGEIRWRFLCGAGVRVTPAFGRGRVLFGSDDGWVYCLEAKTGAIAWRFRAAPEEYFINSGGRLASIWPSTCGVLIDGDVVFCGAGWITYDGCYLYSLDLQTGKPSWAERIGDAMSEEGAPQGIMALAGDAIIVPDYICGHNQAPHNKGGNQAYLKKDGKHLDWYPRDVKIPYQFTLGSEAIADKDLFYYGGSGFMAPGGQYIPIDMKTGWAYKNADPKYNQVSISITPGNIAPVLGRKSIVGDGIGYDRESYCRKLLQDPSALNEAKSWSIRLWNNDPNAKNKTSGLALAGNVLLASGGGEVVAFEAKPDGKELGRVKVQGQISRNSLAVSGGNVFMVTDDGHVYGLKAR